MRVLAICDGSKEAKAAVALFDGYAHVDLRPLAGLSEPLTYRPDLVLIALAKVSPKLMQSLPDQLTAANVGKRPKVVCLPVRDKARLASEIRYLDAQAVSFPIDRDTLFGAIRKADPTLKMQPMGKKSPEKVSHDLSNTFSAMFRSGGSPAEHIQMISASSEDVDRALAEYGIDTWLSSFARHHSCSTRHCMGVTGYAWQWASLLGFSDTDREHFTKAALLHDVGKAAIPIKIVDKAGRLSDDEQTVVSTHVEQGMIMLDEYGKASQLIRDIALQHHELLDGSGYPHGLSGSDISDPVRCMTIVDVYSELVDNRFLQDRLKPEDAWDVLVSMKGKLDPHFVDAFRPIVEMHSDAFKNAA